MIFLVVILLFMHFSRQEQPQKLTLMEWYEMAKSETVIISAEDQGGKILGEYDAGEGVNQKYVTQYVDYQALQIVQWAEKYNIPYDVKRKNQAGKFDDPYWKMLSACVSQGTIARLKTYDYVKVAKCVRQRLKIYRARQR